MDRNGPHSGPFPVGTNLPSTAHALLLKDCRTDVVELLAFAVLDVKKKNYKGKKREEFCETVRVLREWVLETQREEVADLSRHHLKGEEHAAMIIVEDLLTDISFNLWAPFSRTHVLKELRHAQRGMLRYHYQPLAVSVDPFYITVLLLAGSIVRLNTFLKQIPIDEGTFLLSPPPSSPKD